MGLKDKAAWRWRIAGMVLLVIALSNTVRAQDGSIELGIEDDLTVKGTDGTKADPDVELYGYTAFGTNYSGASIVTSGVGQVYIQRSLEIGSNLYVRGAGIVYPDNTTQTTASSSTMIYSLASGECDTNRLDILFSTNYLVSAVRVWQSAAIGQTIVVFTNGGQAASFPLLGGATSQSFSISLQTYDRLGVACTNINGTVLFCFEGRRQ